MQAYCPAHEEVPVAVQACCPNAEVMVAATGLALRTHSWGFLGVHGVSNAVGTRVSNELGAGNHGVARLAVKVSQASGCLDAGRPLVCLGPQVLPASPFPGWLCSW